MPDTPVFSDQPLDVLIVGAGLSGIGTAYWLQKRCPDKQFAILEARQAIGGTWDLFRYPGIRSDSDMHTMGYSFKPWVHSKAISDGELIRTYIQQTAHENGLIAHIRFGHKVLEAAWSTPQACWTVTVEAVASGTQHQLQCRFLYMCSGYYRYDEAHRPHFAGEADYLGQIVQPQFWPPDLAYTGKQVVVVGSGATAVTLVPTLAQTAAHVTMLQRSPTYIATLPSEDAIAKQLRRVLPQRLAYGLTRWKNILSGMLFFRIARRFPAFFKQLILKRVAKELGSHQAVDPHFNPRYKPWDQRFCVVPDGDLFTAIREGRASVITDEIERFTPDGLLLKSGQVVPASIVVLATGLTLQLFGGMQLRVDGQLYEPNQLLVYKGMMLSDVPNLALAFGYTNASWTLKTDLTATYVCRLLRYMDRRGYAIAVPRQQDHVLRQPFLDFSSGYIERAKYVLPQQGSRRPWQVYQNYLLDLLTLRLGRLADGVLTFSPKPVSP